MKINVNDKVLIASADALFVPYNGKVAVVKRIYPDVIPPIAFVEIEEDPTVAATTGLKVPLADLVAIPDKPKTEIPEGAREISKVDFEEALKSVTDPAAAFADTRLEPMGSLVKIMTAKIVGDNAKNEIFRDSDSVVMTEDQFVVTLWNACDPVTVAEQTGKKMSARKCMDVALTAFVSLRDIVSILFGEDGK